MADATVHREQTTCCIVGGGPAGMMLGFLLARAGIAVAVLEKHGDFFRDFRGDTIHPSTLELMHELGLLDALLRRPHQEVRELGALVGTESLAVADFGGLPTRCKFLAIMPQWDFLDFVAAAANTCPGFRLMMNCEGRDLVWRRGRVAGVIAATSQGEVEIAADLVVAADGRHSTLRDKAGIAVDVLGAPMDVLWLRLSRRPGDGEAALGRAASGAILVTINRGEYWQCGFVIAKGSFEARHHAGIEAFRAEIARLVPAFADRVGEIASWDDVKLLTVAVDRVRQWHRPGLLLIGDAAHAMSPIGGVGVNLAVQDAVAAANILAGPLGRGTLTAYDLAAVERRRAWPAHLTQLLQIAIQNRVVRPVLADTGPVRPPRALVWLLGYRAVRRLAARIFGLGFRPEHVRPVRP